jgi:hypothetical protein
LPRAGSAPITSFPTGFRETALDLSLLFRFQIVLRSEIRAVSCLPLSLLGIPNPTVQLTNRCVERFHPCFSLSLFGFHSNSYSVPTSVPCVMTAFAACCPFQDLASSAYTSSPGTAFQILLVPSNALLPASRCLFSYSIQRSSVIGIYLTRVLATRLKS